MRINVDEESSAKNKTKGELTCHGIRILANSAGKQECKMIVLQYDFTLMLRTFINFVGRDDAQYAQHMFIIFLMRSDDFAINWIFSFKSSRLFT